MNESAVEENSPFPGKEGLVNGVIEKHQKFLNEYNAEYSKLEDEVKKLEDTISNSKKKREEEKNRLEVLKEKKQQLYHQANNLLGEMFTACPEKLDNRIMHSTNDDIEELKRTRQLENEEKTIQDVLGKIAELENENTREYTSQIRARIQEASKASSEISSLIKSMEKEENLDQIHKELGEKKPRYNWLERRIKSHKEALEYWKNQKEVIAGNVA
jgi:chromosome segregation ATPase